MIQDELNDILRKLSCLPLLETLKMTSHSRDGQSAYFSPTYIEKDTRYFSEIFNFFKLINKDGCVIFDDKDISFHEIERFMLVLFWGIRMQQKKILLDNKTIELINSNTEYGKAWHQTIEVVLGYIDEIPKRTSVSFNSYKSSSELVITLLGSRISNGVKKIYEQIKHVYNDTITFKCYPDNDFNLTDFYEISKSDIVISNWNHLVYLFRLFLNENPSYNRSLVVLFSGIFMASEYSFEDIKEYGIFDFVILENYPKSDSFADVFKVLNSKRLPFVRQLKAIDYLAYRWGSVDIAPPGSHFKIRVSMSGLKSWYHYKKEFPDDPGILQIPESLEYLWKSVLREKENTMEIKPLWGNPERKSITSYCFTLMPFADPFNIIYTDHIVPVVESLGLLSKRADDYFMPNVIMNDIWHAINDSELIIAELTGRNPNVFYELGIAHTIGKNAILISQNSDDVPFDLRHLRYIKYEYTPRGCELLMKNLKSSLDEILSSKMQKG